MNDKLLRAMSGAALLVWTPPLPTLAHCHKGLEGMSMEFRRQSARTQKVRSRARSGRRSISLTLSLFLSLSFSLSQTHLG